MFTNLGGTQSLFSKENQAFSTYQSGFPKRHSTETAIVYLTDKVVEHLENQRMCETMFMDLKKAFDLVNHNCLLHKLKHYGVKGKALTWFKDYITARTQKVKYILSYLVAWMLSMVFPRVLFLDLYVSCYTLMTYRTAWQTVTEICMQMIHYLLCSQVQKGN